MVSRLTRQGDYARETQQIPAEELVSDLQRVAENLGKTPSEREYDEYGSHSYNTVKRRFGTWNSAVQAAGFEPNETTVEAVSDMEILSDLVDVAAKLEKPPTMTEYNKHGNFHSRTVLRRFGGEFQILAIEAHGLASQRGGED